jgi:hypothetical protein
MGELTEMAPETVMFWLMTIGSGVSEKELIRSASEAEPQLDHENAEPKLFIYLSEFLFKEKKKNK